METGMNDGNSSSVLGEEIGGTGSGLYVDVENFQQDAETVIQELIDSWPVSVPPPRHLALFVRAHQVELWQLWATSQFKNLTVVVFGTQHFSLSPTKNSADISIATRSIADLIQKRISHVVVFSNDSDFISLFAAIRDEPTIPQGSGKVPFTWVVIDRDDSLSPTVKRFFPPENLHVIPSKQGKGRTPKTLDLSTDKASQAKRSSNTDTWAQMALAVVEGIEVGPFKSTECQPIIKNHWSNHPIAKAGGAAFGTEFKNNIWPLLKGHGVVIDNPGGKPVRYRMTDEAKKVLATNLEHR